MRSAIALSTIAFSVVVLLLAGGFVEWIFWATREAAIQNGLGHVQIVKPGYLDSGSANPGRYLLPADSPELRAIESAPGVAAVAPRLNFSGLVSRGDTTLSFLGEGVDPARESRVSRVLRISKGEGLSAAAPDGVILGEGLARNLEANIGDRIVLLVTASSGGVSAVEATVRGLFVTEAKAYDDTALRTPIDLARRLLKTNGAHVWVVALDRTEDTDAFLARFRGRLEAAGLQAVPWYDVSDFYLKTVALLGSQMDAVRLMIALIVLLGISNTLVMNVLERASEIGTLMAMGARRSRVLRLFVGEGLLLGLIGGGAGLAIAVGAAWIVSIVGIPMPPPPGRSAGYSAQILLTWPLAIGGFALVAGTTVLASLYPAWKASRLVIVDALRRNR